MPSDNVTLNSGSGGSTLRTLGDAGGTEWSAAVVCYATTVSPGANVLQVVTASAGLPVSQQGTWTVTASQGGTWTVQPGNTANTTPWLATINQGGNSATVTGSNALKVDGSAVTQPASLASLPALAAGTNLIGSAAVGHQIAQVFNGTTAVTPQYATFSTSSSGATQVVAGQVSKKIYVLRWSVSSNGVTNVNLQSHTTTGQATGSKYLTQYASGGGGYCPAGIMATASGEALDVNNSAAVAISGEVTYVVF